MTGVRTLDTARELGADLADVLAARDIDVTVTMANTAAGGALAAGALVALVLPPSLTFTTYAHHTAAWTVLLIAGPEQDPPAAWDRLDAALDAVAVSLDVDTSRPVTFQDVQGPQWPAFELTFTTEHTH